MKHHFWLFITLSLVCAAISRKPRNREVEADKEIEKEEEKLLMAEWEEHMGDFVPSDLITFDVAARDEGTFYEEILALPSYIRGAYFVATADKLDIDFKILSPSNEIILTKLKKREGIFYFNATEIGEYKFSFQNQRFTGSKQITFAIHSGDSSKEVMLDTHLNPMESKLSELLKEIQDVQVDMKYGSIQQTSHMETVQSSNTNLMLTSLLESVLIIGITGAQIYYIKSLLDNRRII